jgi:hypothetical protein
MAFEVGETVNRCAEWVCSSPFVYGTLSNPVVTALLITAMALAVIYAMYRDDLEDTGWRLGVKTAIWLAVGTSALIYAHYYALERRLRKKSSSQGVRDVMASIHHSASTGGGYAVRGGDPQALPALQASQSSTWTPPQVSQVTQPLQTTPQVAPAPWAPAASQATTIQNAMQLAPAYANATPTPSATQAPSEMDIMGLQLIPPLAN